MNEKEQQYVEQRLLGLSPWQAAKRIGSGFPERDYKSMEARPEVKQALEAGFAENRQRFEVTRQDVIDGIKEGIQVAKLTDDAGNIIKGWTEIAKVCGLVAPEKKELTVNTDVPLLPSQLHSVPDALLLKLIGRTRELEIIDGDFEQFEEVSVDIEAVSDGEETGDARGTDDMASGEVEVSVLWGNEALEEVSGNGPDELQPAAETAGVHSVSLSAPGRAAARFYAKAAKRKAGNKGRAGRNR